MQVRALLPKHREWAERRPSQALHLITFLEAPKRLVRYARKKLRAELDLRVDETLITGLHDGTDSDGGDAWRGNADNGAAADASAEAMLAAFDARLAALGGASVVPQPPPPPPGTPAAWAAGDASAAAAAPSAAGEGAPGSAEAARRAALPPAIVSLDGAGRGKALTMPAWMSVDESAAALGRAEAEGEVLQAERARVAAAAAAAGCTVAQFADAANDLRTRTIAKRRREGDPEGDGGNDADSAEGGSALRAKRARVDGVELASAGAIDPSGSVAAINGTLLASSPALSPHASLLEACEAKHPALASCAKWAALRRVVLTEKSLVAEAWFRSGS